MLVDHSDYLLKFYQKVWLKMLKRGSEFHNIHQFVLRVKC